MYQNMSLQFPTPFKGLNKYLMKILKLITYKNIKTQIIKLKNDFNTSYRHITSFR